MGISLKTLSKYYTNQKNLGQNSELDTCCLSHYECARWKFESNQTDDWENWPCECEYKFRSCLKKVNTLLSSELGFGRSLYVKQCIEKNYPVNQCVMYETFLNPGYEHQGTPRKHEFDSNMVRCLQYEFDESLPKQYQLVDLPFNYNGFTSKELQRLQRNHQIGRLLSTVHGFTQDLHSFITNIRNFHRKFNF